MAGRIRKYAEICRSCLPGDVTCTPSICYCLGTPTPGMKVSTMVMICSSVECTSQRLQWRLVLRLFSKPLFVALSKLYRHCSREKRKKRLISVVPRPSHHPVFDCLQYAKRRGKAWSILSLVSSPDPIFHVCPVDSSKNRVWTLSLRKLGQVYIRRSVNWVIVGVNYIISYQQCLLWRQKICKMDICDDAYRNLLHLSNLIGATTCRYARMITPQFYQ